MAKKRWCFYFYNKKDGIHGRINPNVCYFDDLNECTFAHLSYSSRSYLIVSPIKEAK